MAQSQVVDEIEAHQTDEGAEDPDGKRQFAEDQLCIRGLSHIDLGQVYSFIFFAQILVVFHDELALLLLVHIETIKLLQLLLVARTSVLIIGHLRRPLLLLCSFHLLLGLVYLIMLVVMIYLAVLS